MGVPFHVNTMSEASHFTEASLPRDYDSLLIPEAEESLKKRYTMESIERHTFEPLGLSTINYDESGKHEINQIKQQVPTGVLPSAAFQVGFKIFGASQVSNAFV